MSNKRSNGEGTITLRKDGRWEAKYTFEGKRKAIYGKTQKEVKTLLKQKLREIEIASEKGYTNYIEKSKVTLGQWLDIWLDKYCKTSVRASTYSWYEMFVRVHIKPILGECKMCNLSTEKLQELFNLKKKCPSNNDKTKTLSGRTIDAIRRVIRAALNQAKIDGYILSDPIKGVKIGTLSKPDVRALTREEQFRLHKTVEKWQKEWPSAFAIILSMYTGMRKGEILGLRWCDVDLFTENPTIHVRHSLSRQINLDGGDKKTVRKLSDTKTNGSKRDIPIMPQLLDDFKKYMESQIYLKKQNNIIHQETDFVFQNSVFKEHEPKRFYDKYLEILKDANIQNADFHTLRHTFATRAIENVMDINTLSAILGHAQTSTTVNRYCHAIEEHKKIGMKKVSYIFSFDDNNCRQNQNQVI